MGWKSLVGMSEAKPEPEQIAESPHPWQYSSSRSSYPPTYCWHATNGGRHAVLRWANYSTGRWCTVDLQYRDENDRFGSTVYAPQGMEFTERSFSRALWLAERFLEGRGRIEKRRSGTDEPTDGATPGERWFYCWVTDFHP
jgi:hypothetical protein